MAHGLVSWQARTRAGKASAGRQGTLGLEDRNEKPWAAPRSALPRRGPRPARRSSIASSIDPMPDRRSAFMHSHRNRTAPVEPSVLTASAWAVLCAPMTAPFAALIFRPSEVPDRALSRGFAVALAGFDVPSPHLRIAPLRGIPGYSAAFYSSGLGRDGDDLEHLIELFEAEVSPAVGVLDAATELGSPDAQVFCAIFAEDVIHDDGWRFSSSGFVRHFVRESEDGLEAGVETAQTSEVIEIEIEIEIDDEATDAEELAAEAAAIRPHRGSTFLSSELRAPALPALMGALFDTERRVEVRLIEPGPEAVADEARRLNRALRRVDGRGAFVAPEAIAGIAQPAAHAAFASAYDWADPTDVADRYRELSIGAIEGTLQFLRDADLRALDADPAWARGAGAGLYPVARILGSALGASSTQAILGLAADGQALSLVRAGRVVPAGPTLGELLRYLALGWSQRSDAEEDMIGALMLRARIRTGKD
jgi:hypothetical protein